jgi:RHS repeat-associated protein
LTAGVTYKYDGDGKRVWKTSGKLYWYGTGSDPVMETDLSGNLTDEYIFFGGKRIARRDSSGNVVYYMTDHLGTSRIVTSSAGAILDESDFYPFGGERVITFSSGNTYKFTGKERDTESGLDYMEARYYGSSMGRFMSPDPLGGHLEDPQTLNRYVYAGNNPLRFSDPTGLDFYLQCQTASSSCASQTVGFDKNGVAQTALVQGVTNSDKSFTATQIGNDANGGLVDKTTGTGSYSANVSGSGVQFSQDGGKTSVGGVFVNHDANPTSGDTSIQGSGSLSGFNFTFTNSKMEASQTAAGTFTYNGSLDDARSAMGKAGFSYFPVGGNFGFDEYRSDGTRPDGANSGHFNIDRYKTIPINGVPQVTGNMHFGEHNPLFSPAVHIFGEARQ